MTEIMEIVGNCTWNADIEAGVGQYERFIFFIINYHACVESLYGKISLRQKPISEFWFASVSKRVFVQNFCMKMNL